MEEINLVTIRAAYERIQGYVNKTPLVLSKPLSEMCEGKVYLKLENKQLTGTFKFRGALSKMTTLTDEEKKQGIVTASSGNHAQGVALAAKTLGLSATIFVPKGVSSLKLSRLQQYEVQIKMSNGYDQVEGDARSYAKKHGVTYISPYNDYDVMAGQGTIALEIEKDLSDYDSVIVPVGGGGLISGISVGVKQLHHDRKIYGVVTPGAATMYHSLQAGRLVRVDEYDTLAEAFLGGIEEEAKTFEVTREYVDELFVVQERTTAEAIRLLWNKENQVVEGAGATSVALILEQPRMFEGQCVVAIISGGNIAEDLFSSIIDAK